ncbi:MAG: serpin family protein [Candidatus Diapherotrites archaeon]
MRKSHLLIIALFAASIFLAGCPAPGPAPPPGDETGWTQEGVDSVVNANNQFALDLYSEFKDDPGNVFFSPWSITTAVSMTYEGAKGQTADEMKSVFHFSGNDAVRRPSFARVQNQINAAQSQYLLRSANALWAEQTYPFLEEYTALIEKYYSARVENMDFINDSEGSRETINTWVENQTNDRIQDLIPQGVITPYTRMVLTNAIYFKGTWVKEFKKENTRKGDFHVAPDKTVSADMMHLSEEEFNYAENDELQILELPYKGENLSMLILLPRGNDITSLENSLTSEKLSGLRNQMGEQEVIITLPKFKFEAKYFLSETLAQMGMPTAFDEDEADFSGMDGTDDLFISQVIHQSFVEVNEEGTEAAAATAIIVMGSSAMPQNIFTADHPFIFIIQEKETGNILFLGRVSDPTKQ